MRVGWFLWVSLLHTKRTRRRVKGFIFCLKLCFVEYFCEYGYENYGVFK